MGLKSLAGRVAPGHNFHPRLELKCTIHDNCKKSRSVELMTDTLGSCAPLCYLGAWAEKAASLTHAEHVKYRPTLAEQRDYKLRKLPD